MPRYKQPVYVILAASTALMLASGCTSWREYVRNGFKVGPNYAKPDAPVAQHWIDENDIRIREGEDLSRWWTVFNDDRLNYLVHHAYRQNLSLKEAGFRVLQARAELAIAKGEFFPQNQDVAGAYSRNANSANPPPFFLPSFTDRWNFGFNLNWELDFWGRFRRAIASADDRLNASVENYDDVLVTLLGDVATNYVNARTYQERIHLLKGNVELQAGVLTYIENRLRAGFKTTDLDLNQAISNLRQTEAAIPQLEITLRQFENALCTLLGMPPADISGHLGTGPIPITPVEVVVDMPASLLRRRPDIRAAERNAAAQAEEIGIAKAELYPAFSINGSLGYSAKRFQSLFSQSAFNGSVGPSFNWNILNYGRIVNHVRFQDARFQELVVAYQRTVLDAQQEVENGLVNFLKSQQRTKLLDESVDAAEKAVKIVILQYKGGTVDFNRYATIQQALVTQQDTDAQSRGNIALGLITIYRALGGGWEIRLRNEEAPALPPSTTTEVQDADERMEEVPTPTADGALKPDSTSKPDGASKKRDQLPPPPEEVRKPYKDVISPIEGDVEPANEPPAPNPPEPRQLTAPDTK